MALDREVIATRVRFLLGDPTEAVFAQDTLLMIVDENLTRFGDEDENYCVVVQGSLLESLRYLIRRDQQPSSATGGGALTKRREKRGQSEVEETYSSETDGTDGGWEDMYSDYLQNPDWICPSLAKSSGAFLVSIGGVRKDKFREIQRNPNSKTAYDTPRVNRKFRSLRHKRWHGR